MDNKDFLRFEALYNLALNNPDTNEIRNASVLIVKMIAKHNLLSTIRNSIGKNSYQSTYIPPVTKPNYPNHTEKPKKQYRANFNSFDCLLEYKHRSIFTRAQYTVDFIIEVLESKFSDTGYNDFTISVPTIIDLAMKYKLISPEEITSYTKNIKQLIDYEVKSKVIIGVRGRSGGYKLKV